MQQPRCHADAARAPGLLPWRGSIYNKNEQPARTVHTARLRVFEIRLSNICHEKWQQGGSFAFACREHPSNKAYASLDLRARASEWL